MAEEGVEQVGQHEVWRCEVTRTSNSFGVSLMEVISSSSGKGKSGVVGISYHLLQNSLTGAYQIDRSFSMAHQKPGRAVILR
jgi:hypothetical protein